MENKYKIKQLGIIILIFIIIGVVIFNINFKQEIVIVPENNQIINPSIETTQNEQETKKLCYYRSNATNSGLYDAAWLRLNILEEKITGEFHNIPAETDSKVGSFEGAVGPLVQNIMGRRALVWWDSFAEGMKVKEELIIEFGDGNATVGFGEMADRGDGVYLYKDKTNLTYIEAMDQINCETLDEKLFTEKFIRDNIVTIATDKPVLGGSWYVVSVTANPATKTAEVTYEDGHIQSKANILYSYEKNPQNVTVTKFEIK